MFLNRPGFEAGPGCALHLHAMNTGKHFSDTKPTVCWQLPLRAVDRDEEDDGSVTTVLTEFGRDGWGEGGEEFAGGAPRRPRRSPAASPSTSRWSPSCGKMLGDDVYEEVAKYMRRPRRLPGPPPMPHPAEVPVSLGRTRIRRP